PVATRAQLGKSRFLGGQPFRRGFHNLVYRGRRRREMLMQTVKELVPRFFLTRPGFRNQALALFDYPAVLAPRMERFFFIPGEKIFAYLHQQPVTLPVTLFDDVLKLPESGLEK